MSVHIVTDSACDLEEHEIAGLPITIVPLSIRFGDREFIDREELSAADFYTTMASSDALPETAAPAPGRFQQAFLDAAAAGATGVLCIDLAEVLSATIQSARNAAKAVADTIEVRVIDSHTIAGALGTQVLLAARAAADGASLDDLEALIEDLAGRSEIFAALDTLENLKKGGRIGGAQALIGSMLSIKPLVHLDTQGAVEEAGKQRTRRRALEWLRDRLYSEPNVEHLCVSHGQAPDIDDFLALIADRYPADQIRISTIGAVIGTHAGPRVIGVCYLR